MQANYSKLSLTREELKAKRKKKLSKKTGQRFKKLGVRWKRWQKCLKLQQDPEPLTYQKACLADLTALEK